MRFAPKMLSIHIAYIVAISYIHETCMYFRTRTRYINVHIYIYIYIFSLLSISNNNVEAPCSLVHFASDKFSAPFPPMRLTFVNFEGVIFLALTNQSVNYNIDKAQKRRNDEWNIL